MTQHDDDITDRLSREMHGKADRISEAPINLGTVKARASSIRRRRATVTGIVTLAAAAAIIVPTAIFSSGVLDDSTPDPARSDFVQTLDQPVLITDRAPQGDAPAIPYLDGRTLTTPDGQSIQVQQDYDAFAPVGDEFLGIRQGSADTHVDVLDAQGNVVDTSLTTNVAVSSADGNIAAWGTPSGEVMARFDGRTVRLGTVPRPVQPVEVVGSDTCDPGSDCTVYYNEVNRQFSPGVINADGTSTELAGGIRRTTAVSAEGLVAGLTTDPDSDESTATCSAVHDQVRDEQKFELCDLVFNAPRTGFAPDGRSVVAEEPGTTNPTEISILDSETGTTRAKLRIKADQAAKIGVISDTIWEDSEHLLVKTKARRNDPDVGHSFFRVGLDGSVEKLLHGDGTAPWVLPY